MDKIRVAICYDFDKTLSQNDMQSYGFIKRIGMDIDDFWAECGKFTAKHTSSNILSYLYMILEKCREKGIKPTKEFFMDCAKDIEYFNGIDTYFDNLNKFAESKGVK